MEAESEEGDEVAISLKTLIFSTVLFFISIVTEHLKIDFAFQGVSVTKIASTALCFFVYILCGKNVILSAIKNIFHGAIFDEKFLMSLASICAIFVGEVSEAVAVMLFYQIGEFFQDYAVDKSRSSIKSLMNICPDTANVLKNGEVIKIDAKDVKVGDTVIVMAGERVPLDGIVTKGKTFLDNSSLTGESVPVEVFEGNEVFSGAVNQGGVIEVKATKIATDSSACRILKLVEESAEKKSKTENFITRFSKIYTPIVCCLALTVAFVPPIILRGNFHEWLYRALILLVVSCPCAIVVSVPLSFFGGIGSASKKGILVKGSTYLESLSKMKTAVFDKTGTLTKGVFVVRDVHLTSDKTTEDELIAVAAHAEIYSNHPVAKSLKTAHHAECCSLLNITDSTEISGEGIKVCVNGKTILAGNEKLMISQNVKNYSQCKKDDTGTIVHVAIDGDYAGHILISDVTKDDAKLAIDDLHALGVKKIVMLTGDNETVAEKVSSSLGIDEFYAKLLPEDKVKKVEELMAVEKTPTRPLAFVGDGINDSPVLKRADIGIAMGALGSDAAIEAADVVIMTDEPSKIAVAIKTARKTLRIVKQNIAFSLIVKFSIMILGGFGIANMWMAVFGDTGVSLLAVINAMRAMRKK